MLLVLLPWLVVLALLALPSNRNSRAWLIWVPLVGLALLGIGLQAALAALNISNFGSYEVLSAWVQAACSAPFGLTTIWLLGAGLARRCRTLGIVLMALVFAALSLLAFGVSPEGEQLWDRNRWESALFSEMLLFWVASGLIFTGALNLTGWRCRKWFGRLRVSLWLPVWLWIMSVVVAGGFGGVMTLVGSETVEWIELLVGASLLSLVSFLMILPFLMLSFTSSFYRERLRRLLRLPAPDAAPPAQATAPVAALGSPQ